MYSEIQKELDAFVYFRVYFRKDGALKDKVRTHPWEGMWSLQI